MLRILKVFSNYFNIMLFLSISLHTEKSYCAISCDNLGILYVFFEYSDPTCIPIYCT